MEGVASKLLSSWLIALRDKATSAKDKGLILCLIMYMREKRFL